MWELDCEESWAPKNWCFWTVVLEKTLESPLDCKEIQPVHSKGDQYAFELWCWRRLLRVPWTARRCNQSILKISPGCSLEGMILKLKLQYFGHLMQRVDSLENTLMLGGIGGSKKRGRQRTRWLDGITNSMVWVCVNSGSWWWTGRPGVLQFMGLQRVTTEQLNWLTDPKSPN